MCIIKRLLFALIAVTLLTGAVRDLRTESKLAASKSQVLLLRTAIGEIDASAECLPLFAIGLVAACDAETVNEFTVPRDMYVSSVLVKVKLAGDSGYQCDVFIEDAKSAVGTTTVVPIDTAQNALYEQVQSLVILKGALIGIRVNDGTASCDGTIDPKFVVELWGNYTD